MNALRRCLILIHRWLGIVGSVFFVAWFASGITMVYARMPRLTPEERLIRLPPLDLASLSVDAGAIDGRPQRVRIGMLRGRPVYRFHDGGRWTTLFADDAARLVALDSAAATESARALWPEHAAHLRYDRRLDTPDQWTLQIRGFLPAHRIALGDAGDSYLYISEQSGEPVLITSRDSRTWGYASAVVHWVYFTPIRQHSATWVQLIIWTSVAGCVLCLTGLIWGVWQFVRVKRAPYTGLLRWHHSAGLVFGLVAFTFVFSGLLSMDPWAWSPGTAPTRAQREAVAGGPLNLEAVTAEKVQAAAAVLAREFPIKEIELIQVRGAIAAEAYRASAPAPGVLGDPAAVVDARLPLEHRLVLIDAPERGTFTRFADDVMLAAARDAMPAVPIADAVWLDQYDSYYYDRYNQLPLPVLRVRYADPKHTWLYLDPRQGAIVRKEETLTRINRWLYHGLHSLDFPGLYQRRPLWDAVVIGLCVGGLFLSVSSAPAGWRRVARLVRGLSTE